MANKRMISLSICDTDAFLEMPLTTQALYFHLNLRADDDGFIGNPKKIARLINASEDDLKLLLLKRFILAFEDGVIVIKHWRIHNTLSAGRYHATNYIDDKKMLKIKENKAYSLNSGTPLDDDHLIEMSNRQISQTNIRRTLDEHQTNSDIDIDKNSKDKKEESIFTNVNISSLSSSDSDQESEKNIKKYQWLVEEWNTLSEFGIASIRDIKDDNSNRTKNVRARLKSYSRDDVMTAIENIRHSAFLQGKKSSWKITFDWFMLPSNFPKVLDGNYNDNDTEQSNNIVQYRNSSSNHTGKGYSVAVGNTHEEEWQ